jgi:ComF family protein
MPVDYLNRLKTWLIDTIWPKRCTSCGRLGSVACSVCLDLLAPLTPQRCPGCQRPSRMGIPCSACRDRVAMDRLIAATSLTEVSESFIYALKYRGIRELAEPLAVRLCDLVQVRPDMASLFGSNPLVMPVPLHSGRLRERGFNQSELLAHRIAAFSAMPLVTGALIRKRATGQQVRTASKAERRENMQGAFTVTDAAAVTGRDVVLVDDVVTTGATLEDCARALKEAGTPAPLPH